MFIQLFVLIGIGIPLVLAWSLGRIRPSWSRRKVVLISAGPIPAIAAIPSFVLIVYAMTAAAENCGDDACATERGVGLVLLAVVGGVFIIGALLASGVVAIVRRENPDKVDLDLFE